jgi:vacuole morphology and inheritance protein 14
MELLDKFKTVQEKARKSQRVANMGEHLGAGGSPVQEKEKIPPEVPPKSSGLRGAQAPIGVNRPLPTPAGQQGASHKPRGGLSNLGRFAGGVAGRRKK